MSTADEDSSIPRLGIVGGGQLARMTVQAATSLGVQSLVLDPDPDCPAAQAGATIIDGDPDDADALASLAALVDVITFDHERVPIPTLQALEATGATLRPQPHTAQLAFDKSIARRRWSEVGFPVPRFSDVETAEDVEAFAETVGWPIVLKAAREGYDGRGVAVLEGSSDVPAAVDALGPAMIVEEFVAFDSEIAVIVARRPGGEMVTYEPVTTVQADGMCVEVVYPSNTTDALRATAAKLAEAVAVDADLVGIMAIEMFVTGDEVLINEVATRPHNTGHLTIEASETSQFEQHVRCVLDLPLGQTTPRSGAAVMRNIVGDDAGTDPVIRLPLALAIPGVHVHLYGKASRPGRKLGHVTVLGPDAADVRTTANRAADALNEATPEPKVNP